MTDDEIEAVAQELAKIGGTSWYPGRTQGSLTRLVSERFRDRAKVAIAALDRLRASTAARNETQITAAVTSIVDRDSVRSRGDHLEVGSIVVYRPPGDQRAIACRVEKLADGRAYLVPCPRPDVGWVPIDSPALKVADGTRK